MQKIILALAICIFLAGCSVHAQNNPESSEPLPQIQETVTDTQVSASYILYIPNEDADGWVKEEIIVDEITPDIILKELQNRKIINGEVKINSFSRDVKQLIMDFNQPFADQISSTGTAGEYMVTGSVVNTFLNAFQADSVFFTVENKILESGHVIYDFPIPHME